VHSLHSILSVWQIRVHVIFLASPTLDRWSSPFSQGVFLLEILLSILILMISLRLIPIEGSFESFPPLIKLCIILVLPIFLQGVSFLAFIVHVFILLDGLSQGLGFIILDVFLIEGWKSTYKSSYFHFLITNELDIL
jgi:hypothetical protein